MYDFGKIVGGIIGTLLAIICFIWDLFILIIYSVFAISAAALFAISEFVRKLTFFLFKGEQE